MKIDKYPVIIGETSMVFEFISQGIHGSIPKLVIYSKTHLHNFYNLGFGDKDETTRQIDDEVVTNNGDSEKVLATVASTLYILSTNFRMQWFLQTGSTKARTRLYRIGISNNLSEIEEDVEVYGLVGDKWQPFQKQTEFDGFLVLKKKSNFTT